DGRDLNVFHSALRSESLPLRAAIRISSSRRFDPNLFLSALGSPSPRAYVQTDCSKGDSLFPERWGCDPPSRVVKPGAGGGRGTANPTADTLITIPILLSG
ncbi:MAG: hypothetical protein ABEI31_06595, partial [Halodesulfurarchaeum sp.]